MLNNREISKKSRFLANCLVAIALILTLLFSNSIPVLAATNSTQLTEAELQELQEVFEEALTASNEGDFVAAEELWSQLIEKLPDNPALWSNRGNIRVSQNKLDEAFADYAKAIELAPYAPDPYLNRGIVYERLENWEEAIADYNRVLEIYPEDPIAYNNRGNAEAGNGEWEKAIADYQKAFELFPDYAFAKGNYALALYQTGQTETAVKTIKQLLRKYPNFADMRAALTACLWAEGKQGEAESNWVAAVGLDSRYQDIEWVTKIRRWPPALTNGLEKFLKLQ
jgi:tetratricopeptide (TPR) repeat protein